MYYTPWCFTDASCIACGIAYNGEVKGEKGKSASKWDRIQGIYIWKLETASTPLANDEVLEPPNPLLVEHICLGKSCYTWKEARSLRDIRHLCCLSLLARFLPILLFHVCSMRLFCRARERHIPSKVPIRLHSSTIWTYNYKHPFDGGNELLRRQL